MYCSVLHYLKLKVSKQGFSKIDDVEYRVLFFSILYLTLFSRGFCQKLYEKTFPFQYKFSNSISRCTVFLKFYNLEPPGTKMAALAI